MKIVLAGGNARWPSCPRGGGCAAVATATTARASSAAPPTNSSFTGPGSPPERGLGGGVAGESLVPGLDEGLGGARAARRRARLARGPADVTTCSADVPPVGALGGCRTDVCTALSTRARRLAALMGWQGRRRGGGWRGPGVHSSAAWHARGAGACRAAATGPRCGQPRGPRSPHGALVAPGGHQDQRQARGPWRRQQARAQRGKPAARGERQPPGRRGRCRQLRLGLAAARIGRAAGLGGSEAGLEARGGGQGSVGAGSRHVQQLPGAHNYEGRRLQLHMK